MLWSSSNMAYKATVAYKFDRTVSQHLSYVYSGSAARLCVHLYCGIAALAALPLWAALPL